MEFTELNEAFLSEFLHFCRRNRGLLDDSYLGDEDLASFSISPKDPTIVKVSARGAVVGAASVLFNDAALGTGRARIRVLYSESGKPSSLERLMKQLLPKLDGIKSLFVFCPDDNRELIGLYEDMGFEQERIVLHMVLEGAKRSKLGLPAGCVIRHFRVGQDEESWCRIRNSAFSQLKGNDAPLTPATVAGMAEDPYATDGGMLVLYCQEEPVAVARGEKDEFGGKPVVSIGPVAVLPDYQGKGLGRALLRAAMNRALDEGISSFSLSVNSDNLTAINLYSAEGFKKERGFACHVLDLRNPAYKPF